MASSLVHWAPDRAVMGSSPDRGHCVVFLGKTLYSHNASLHPSKCINLNFLETFLQTFFAAEETFYKVISAQPMSQHL